MAIIVEDGTGKADAETYISVADATAYHAARGNAAWAALATDAIREQCLRKATDYMLQNYRQSWKGSRVLEVQALDWPRYEVYRDDFGSKGNGSAYLVDSDIVPVEVKYACAELALKAATAELNPDLEQAKVSETVGPISVTYNTNSPEQKRFRAIDMMLRPYLFGKGLSVGVVRS